MAIIEKILKVKSRFLKKFVLLPYILSLSSYKSCELVIVTGADSTHSKSLHQFLTSLYVHEPKIRAIVFDLGLSLPDREHLRSCFPRVELREFNYSNYPDYFNIKVNAGEYAWKPVIFCDVFNELKCCVCWMDAGNLITDSLFRLRIITKRVGMYSPHSSGCISDWTHSKTLTFLNAPSDILNKPNLSGACVAACYQSKVAVTIVNQWKKCALTRSCIAPEGSSRKNHRQDQAVLSVLAHKAGITRGMLTTKYGFEIHQDID